VRVQAEQHCCSHRVASIIKRIDQGCTGNRHHMPTF